MMGRTTIWMCGGGVQSTAIAVLIAKGMLPKPDLAVIADTEREMSTTWGYLNKWTVPALAEVGVQMHRVLKSKYATKDLWGGTDGNTPLIPVFTNQSGEVGKLTAYCSGEWKREVVRRWANKEHGVKAVTNWIGFSIDEMNRVGKLLKSKKSKGKWQVRFPLIELRMNRGDCMHLVLSHGWPQPPRSSCWMCPNHTQDEWRWQKENASKDFAKAVRFEREIQKRDPNAWLHSECVPLDQADLDDRQEVMFGRCDSGMCFV